MNGSLVSDKVLWNNSVSVPPADKYTFHFVHIPELDRRGVTLQRETWYVTYQGQTVASHPDKDRLKRAITNVYGKTAEVKFCE